MNENSLFSDGSPSCAVAKRFLEWHALEFEEVDVRASEGFRRLLKRTRQKMVPALEIRHAHSIRVLVGFEKPMWEVELGLHKGVQQKLL